MKALLTQCRVNRGEICLLAGIARLRPGPHDQNMRQAASFFFPQWSKALTRWMRTSAEVSNITFNYLADVLSQLCDGRLEALLLPGAGAIGRLKMPYAST